MPLKLFMSFLHETNEKKCVYNPNYLLTHSLIHSFIHRSRITLKWKVILNFMPSTLSNTSVPNDWKSPKHVLRELHRVTAIFLVCKCGLTETTFSPARPCYERPFLSSCSSGDEVTAGLCVKMFKWYSQHKMHVCLIIHSTEIYLVRFEVHTAASIWLSSGLVRRALW
jgi:hypothetical protein